MKCSDLKSLFETAPEVMTPSEVGALIRASESHLYRLIAQGRLPCFCIGVHYRVLKGDVIKCLEHETRRAVRISRPPPHP